MKFNENFITEILGTEKEFKNNLLNGFDNINSVINMFYRQQKEEFVKSSYFLIISSCYFESLQNEIDFIDKIIFEQTPQMKEFKNSIEQNFGKITDEGKKRLFQKIRFENRKILIPNFLENNKIDSTFLDLYKDNFLSIIKQILNLDINEKFIMDYKKLELNVLEIFTKNSKNPLSVFLMIYEQEVFELIKNKNNELSNYLLNCLIENKIYFTSNNIQNSFFSMKNIDINIKYIDQYIEFIDEKYLYSIFSSFSNQICRSNYSLISKPIFEKENLLIIDKIKEVLIKRIGKNKLISELIEKNIYKELFDFFNFTFIETYNLIQNKGFKNEEIICDFLDFSINNLKSKEEFELFKNVLKSLTKIELILKLIEYVYNRNKELYSFINNIKIFDNFKDQELINKLFDKKNNLNKTKNDNSLLTYKENNDEKIKQTKEDLLNILSSF